MIRLAMRGVSPCTGKISGKFAVSSGMAASEKVAYPVMQVNSGDLSLNPRPGCRDHRPDQETEKAGFLLDESPVIGKELADFWEELLINQYCNF